MRFQLLLIITMMFSLTAFSQITGIQTETKKEIIKTLLDYPLVLEELKLEQNKTMTLESILNNEREKISIHEAVLQNKELEISNLNEQKKAYENQLRKSLSGFYIYGSTPINSSAFSPEVGVLFQFKNKLFVNTGVQYNNITSQTDWKIGVGVKIF